MKGLLLISSNVGTSVLFISNKPQTGWLPLFQTTCPKAYVPFSSLIWKISPSFHFCFFGLLWEDNLFLTKFISSLGIFTLASSFIISAILDRKSTRLNSSHVSISYAVFCLKKKIQLYLIYYYN